MDASGSSTAAAVARASASPDSISSLRPPTTPAGQRAPKHIDSRRGWGVQGWSRRARQPRRLSQPQRRPQDLLGLQPAAALQGGCKVRPAVSGPACQRDSSTFNKFFQKALGHHCICRRRTCKLASSRGCAQEWRCTVSPTSSATDPPSPPRPSSSSAVASSSAAAAWTSCGGPAPCVSDGLRWFSQPAAVERECNRLRVERRVARYLQ